MFARLAFFSVQLIIAAFVLDQGRRRMLLVRHATLVCRGLCACEGLGSTP